MKKPRTTIKMSEKIWGVVPLFFSFMVKGDISLRLAKFTRSEKIAFE